MHRCHGIAVWTLVCLVPLLLAVDAGTPLGSVQDVLDRAQAEVASERSRNEKLMVLSDLARELLDTELMGRRALGERFESLEPAEQEEFQELFDEVLVRAYLRRLLLFRKPVFGFGEVRQEGDRALVPTRIRTTKDAYSVDYPLHRQGERWTATDIVVEGISLVANYREQFDSLLRSQTFTELLDRMRRANRKAAKRDPA